MTKEEIEELQKVYELASAGSANPGCVITPDGAFFADGHVADFDDEGNFFPLTEDEQEVRRLALKSRIALRGV